MNELEKKLAEVRNAMKRYIGREELTEEELDKFRNTYEKLAEQARAAQQKKKRTAA